MMQREHCGATAEAPGSDPQAAADELVSVHDIVVPRYARDAPHVADLRGPQRHMKGPRTALLRHMPQLAEVRGLQDEA